MGNLLNNPGDDSAIPDEKLRQRFSDVFGYLQPSCVLFPQPCIVSTVASFLHSCISRCICRSRVPRNVLMHSLFDAIGLAGSQWPFLGPIQWHIHQPLQHQPARHHLQCRSVKSKVPVASISNQTILGPEGNKIPIRIYYPADAKPRKKGLPILVYCHGGGFFAGDLDSYDDLCRNLGHLSAYIVISVDYRYVSHLLPCCMVQLSTMHCCT